MSQDATRPTYSELLADAEELFRRAKVIEARLKRLEFTGSQPDNPRMTALAAFIATLSLLYGAGIPLPMLVRLLGEAWGHWDQKLLGALLEQLRNEVIMNLPTDPNAKVN